MSVDDRLRAALRPDGSTPAFDQDAYATVVEGARQQRRHRLLVTAGGVAAAATVVAAVSGGLNTRSADPPPTQPRPSQSETTSPVRGYWQSSPLSDAQADQYLRHAHLPRLADRWAAASGRHGDAVITFVQQSSVELWLGDRRNPYVKLIAVGSPAPDAGYLRLRDDEHTIILGFRVDGDRLSLHVAHATGKSVAGQSARAHARSLFEPLTFRRIEEMLEHTRWRWPGLATG